MKFLKLCLIYIFFSPCFLIAMNQPSDAAIKKTALAVLGLPENSSKVNIKRAFHTFALKYHPDKDSSGDAEEKFKEIKAAYECLNDPTKCGEFYSSFGSRHKYEQGDFEAGHQPANKNNFISRAVELLEAIERVFKGNGLVNLFNYLDHVKKEIKQYGAWDDNVINILEAIVVGIDIMPEFKTAQLEKKLEVARDLKKFVEQERKNYSGNLSIVPRIDELLSKINSYLDPLEKEIKAFSESVQKPELLRENERRLAQEKIRQENQRREEILTQEKARLGRERRENAEHAQKPPYSDWRFAEGLSNPALTQSNTASNVTRASQNRSFREQQLPQALTNFSETLRRLSWGLRKQKGF